MISKIKILVLTVLSGTLFNDAAIAASDTASKEPPAHSGSYNTTPWPGNTKDVLKMLQYNTVNKLLEMQERSNNDNQKAWYQLAIITKRDSWDTKLLGNDLLAWRTLHPSHPANQLLPRDEDLQNMIDTEVPDQIAVLLPESGTFREPAKKIRQGIMNAYYKNSGHVGRQNIKFYDTSKSNISAAYKLAMDDGATFIIGPLQKEQVTHLSKREDYKIPTLVLNYTDDDKSLPDNFFEFGLLPEDEALQMAEDARQAGNMHALVIAPKTDWGKRMTMAFTERWQSLGGDIRETWYFSGKVNIKDGIAQLLKINIAEDKKLMRENNKREALEKQRRQDFDVVILFATPENARAIVPLLRYYYVRDVAVYGSSSILDQPLNSVRDIDFDKVIVCHLPITTTPASNHGDPSENRLYSLGEDAYQLSHAITRLVVMPDFPLYGSTGTLTINSNQQIHRRLPCDAINKGNIQPS